MNLQTSQQYAIKVNGVIQHKYTTHEEANYQLSNLRQSQPGLYERASVVIVAADDNRELLLG